MAEVTSPIALDESLNTTESTPRNIADVLASGLENIANNVKPDGSDISISVPGMSANNVDDGFSELKQSLDGLIKFKYIYRDVSQSAGSDFWTLTLPASITGYTKLIMGVDVIALDSTGSSCYVKSYKIDNDTTLTAYIYNTGGASVNIRLVANVVFIPNSHEL